MSVSYESSEFQQLVDPTVATREEPKTRFLYVVPEPEHESIPDLEDPDTLAKILANDPHYIGDTFTEEERLRIAPVYRYAAGYLAEPVDHLMPSHDTIRATLGFRAGPVGCAALSTLRESMEAEVRPNTLYL